MDGLLGIVKARCGDVDEYKTFFNCFMSFIFR